MEDIVNISGLNKWFGTFHVLKDIDLSVKPKERIVIAGPSGSGKSTLIRCINRLEEHQRGKIVVDGVELTNNLEQIEAIRREVGMVFQHFNLFPHLTILENCILAPMWVRKMPRKDAVDRAMYYLERVRIPEQANKYPGQLSGGQQQRVALARALAPKPLLLLMDEPFSNLDQELREHMGQEVSDMLKENDITCVMVTHDQNDAFALGDHVGVMADGAIVQWDTPYNLYHQPRTHFVADFIGNGIFLPGTVSGSARVATALGELESDEALDRPVESPIEVLLRPDDVVHDPEGPIRATVRRRAFKGAEIMYTLRTTQGITLLALFPSHANYEIGDEVSVRLAVDHLVVFDRDSED